MAKRSGRNQGQVNADNANAKPCQNVVAPPTDIGLKGENQKGNNQNKVPQKGCEKAEAKCCKESDCKSCPKAKCDKQQCAKKDRKENKEQSMVSLILALILLMVSTAIQFVYFITQTDHNFGFSFFDRIKGYFNGHQGAFAWLRFATAFSLATEMFAVAFKVIGLVFHVGCFVNRLILGIISLFIVPLTIVASLVLVINYFPQIIPSQIRPFTSRIPKLPESIKAKVDPVVNYIIGAEFRELIARKFGKVGQMFGRLK